MKKILTSHITKIGVLTLIVVGGLTVNYVLAAIPGWNDPVDTPPNKNTPTPLNVGIVNQVKDAGLSLLSLVVNGPVQIQDGTEGAGKVLVSDATGVASWMATSSLGITGGSGGGSTLNSVFYTVVTPLGSEVQTDVLGTYNMCVLTDVRTFDNGGAHGGPIEGCQLNKNAGGVWSLRAATNDASTRTSCTAACFNGTGGGGASLPACSDGDALIYNASIPGWECGAPSGGGGASSIVVDELMSPTPISPGSDSYSGVSTYTGPTDASPYDFIEFGGGENYYCRVGGGCNTTITPVVPNSTAAINMGSYHEDGWIRIRFDSNKRMSFEMQGGSGGNPQLTFVRGIKLQGGGGGGGSLPTTCADGETLTYNTSLGDWECSTFGPPVVWGGANNSDMMSLHVQSRDTDDLYVTADFANGTVVYTERKHKNGTSQYDLDAVVGSSDYRADIKSVDYSTVCPSGASSASLVMTTYIDYMYLNQTDYSSDYDVLQEPNCANGLVGKYHVYDFTKGFGANTWWLRFKFFYNVIY